MRPRPVEDWERLIKNLKKKDYNVRTDAMRALGETGDARAVGPLLEALEYIDNTEVPVRANAQDPESWFEQMSQGRPFKQRASVFAGIRLSMALREIGEPAVEPLIKALGDDNWKVREAAAEALGEIGDARAVELLIEMFGNVSADWNERMSAVWALGKIGDARAVEPLNEVLEYNDYDHINRHYRGAAARALGMIGSARAVEALVKALRDDNRDVRKEAAWALGETGDGCAVGPLIRFFIRTVQPPGLEPNPLPTSRYLHTEFETSYEAVADALRKLPGVGAEFERLGLYDKGEEFYNCYDMLEEAAAMRRAKAEMAAPRTEVHGDYIDDRDTIVKDSVVSKSSIGSSGKSKSEELRDAKALLDDGIIDDAEFQQMKKEILGK